MTSRIQKVNRFFVIIGNADCNSFLLGIALSPLLLIFFQSLCIKFSLPFTILLINCNTNNIQDKNNADKDIPLHEISFIPKKPYLIKAYTFV